MGEYAKYGNSEIKIGTCENMYYLRYEDRYKVTAIQGNAEPATDKNLRWRLPHPEEDNLKPGQYREHLSGLRLYKKDDQNKYCIDFTWQGLEPGTIQLTHESGLLLNVPCHHGEKLPDLGEVEHYGRINPVAHWNGKSWFFELIFIKNLPEKIVPIVRCRHCNHQWSFDWADIWEFIPEKMQERLKNYK